MVEEKMKILKMLEEGKITADEAVNLLNSLDGKSKPNLDRGYESKNMQNNTQPKNKTESSFTMDLEKKIEVLSRDLEPKIKKAAKTIMDTADSFAEKIAKSFSYSPAGPQSNDMTFEMYVSKGDNTQLRLKSKNGPIHIKGYNGDKITAKIKYSCKGGSQKIELLKVDNTYYLNYDEANFTFVAIEAFVPEFLFSRVFFESNSNVYVDALSGDEITILTNDGSIELKNISAKNMKLESARGNILLENITGELLRAESCNGYIDVKLSDIAKMDLLTSNGEINIDSSIRELKAANYYEWNAETSNAAIKLNSFRGFDIGYDFKALTSLNGIHVHIPSVDFIENEKNFVKGMTKNYPSASKKVKINLETSNAPITLY
ncbi:MAG TPA: DUF4097 family beta strand repeat-containing protein [Defluviitaleaceae bacterium]|jgi:DUF4097 and DUF4098 domain-containing protein YvlB|nr:DUF4097 family beta strand repeat protein [Candidatus Epulonipiscium sp.]HOQ16569.1 DUF4097 family beta strand repeat-containing protein [Defluviitaleaceae bacterium]HPT75903.1 DUF4097 family beta strand repeat-containing protein [Defluviitaleaceae bacterium]HQD50214.1 DUF4097 family beta strand repeat-containing protein [Defluviitaleaceae bacterium]